MLACIFLKWKCNLRMHKKTYIFVIHGCKNCHWLINLMLYTLENDTKMFADHENLGINFFNIEDIWSFYGDMRKIPFSDNGANKMAAILTRGWNWRGPISKNINNDQRDECTKFHACTPKCPFFFTYRLDYHACWSLEPFQWDSIFTDFQIVSNIHLMKFTYSL